MGCGGTCRNAWFVVRGSMLLRKRKGLIRVRNPSSRGSEQGKVPPQAVTSLPRELRRDSAPVTKFPEREGACADRRQARYARAVVRSVRTDGEVVVRRICADKCWQREGADIVCILEGMAKMLK